MSNQQRLRSDSLSVFISIVHSTMELTLRCPAWSRFLYLALKTQQTWIFMRLLPSTHFFGNVSNMIHDNATIAGVINNIGGSFISMEWKFPGNEVKGLYKCAANGVDGTGHPLSVITTSLVTSEIPDTIKLAQVVRNLMINMDYALENSCTSGCWQGRLERMKNAVFDISTLYNGHRYLLSKMYNLANVPVAQESCELYGGYLAEIDDENEMLFVQKFMELHRSDSYIFVVIGGTDEGHEHHWVFDRSGRNVTYTKWISGHPLTNPTLNCLFLHRDYGWTMDDYLCLDINRTYNFKYLCELPDQ
ncbi:unnamed protein product [Lymnaea stagnalis]|uniref:C-type lectin domain-containing protein n=1 Tax=Lymnaea stagnalis TaxID=6523 RepID=A0AAV2IG41_LYMST